MLMLIAINAFVFFTLNFYRYAAPTLCPDVSLLNAVKKGICCRQLPQEHLHSLTENSHLQLRSSSSSVRSCRTSSWNAGEPSPSSGRLERTPHFGWEHLPLVLLGARKLHQCSAASSALPCYTRTLLKTRY